MPPKEPEPNPEVIALADAIGVDPVPDLDNPPKVASEEKPEHPDGEPATSEEKPGETEKEAEARIAEETAAAKAKEDNENLLKGIDFAKPEEALKALLKISSLAPVLQSWSDLGVKPQVEQQVQERLEAERGSIVASERQTAEEKQQDEHFASMSQEEIADEISKDDKAADAYARYKQRLQSATRPPDPDAIIKTSEVYAVAHQVTLNNRLVESSELPPEAKEKLKGENFTGQGREGLLAWSQGIFEALVEQEATKLVDKGLEERWEAFKQEHLAEVDGDRPASVSGRRAASVPDLVGTPTDELWAGAFADRPIDKQKEGEK